MPDLASLHAGLIERARVMPGPAGIIKLRSATASPPKVAGPVQLPQAQHLTARPLVPHIPARRYGLTLRVDYELRQDLARFTEQTGRTMQSVLHSALAGYLDRASMVLNHKE